MTGVSPSTPSDARTPLRGRSRSLRPNGRVKDGRRRAGVERGDGRPGESAVHDNQIRPASCRPPFRPAAAGNPVVEPQHKSADDGADDGGGEPEIQEEWHRQRPSGSRWVEKRRQPPAGTKNRPGAPESRRTEPRAFGARRVDLLRQPALETHGEARRHCRAKCRSAAHSETMRSTPPYNYRRTGGAHALSGTWSKNPPRDGDGIARQDEGRVLGLDFTVLPSTTRRMRTRPPLARSVTPPAMIIACCTVVSWPNTSCPTVFTSPLMKNLSACGTNTESPGRSRIRLARPFSISCLGIALLRRAGRSAAGPGAGLRV